MSRCLTIVMLAALAAAPARAQPAPAYDVVIRGGIVVDPWPLSSAIERLRAGGHAPNTAFFASQTRFANG